MTALKKVRPHNERSSFELSRVAPRSLELKTGVNEIPFTVVRNKSLHAANAVYGQFPIIVVGCPFSPLWPVVRWRG